MEGLAKLGIDLWSIFLYLLNTGLLLAVLVFLVYKPLLKFLDNRREQIRSSVDEARELKDQLDRSAEEAEKAQAQAEEKLKREMENLRKFTEEKRVQLTAEMESAKAALLAKAEEEIERRKQDILKDAEAATMETIKKIVLHIVQSKVPEEVVTASIKDAWKKLK